MKTAGMILLVISCSGLGFHMAGLYGRRIAECVRIERLLMRLGGARHLSPKRCGLREEKGQTAFLAFSAIFLDVWRRAGANSAVCGKKS